MKCILNEDIICTNPCNMIGDCAYAQPLAITGWVKGRLRKLASRTLHNIRYYL